LHLSGAGLVDTGAQKKNELREMENHRRKACKKTGSPIGGQGVQAHQIAYVVYGGAKKRFSTYKTSANKKTKNQQEQMTPHSYRSGRGGLRHCPPRCKKKNRTGALGRGWGNSGKEEPLERAEASRPVGKKTMTQGEKLDVD